MTSHTVAICPGTISVAGSACCAVPSSDEAVVSAAVHIGCLSLNTTVSPGHVQQSCDDPSDSQYPACCSGTLLPSPALQVGGGSPGHSGCSTSLCAEWVQGLGMWGGGPAQLMVMKIGTLSTGGKLLGLQPVAFPRTRRWSLPWGAEKGLCFCPFLNQAPCSSLSCLGNNGFLEEFATVVTKN